MRPGRAIAATTSLAATGVAVITLLASQQRQGDDPPGGGDGARTRVMTFNVLTSWARPPAPAWEERRAAVVASITGPSPDIAGLQEVTRRQLEHITAELPGYTVVAGGEDNEVTRQYNPILVDAERYAVRQQGSFWLSDTPELAGSRGWDAMFGRVATWARLHDRRCDCELAVVNTHLDHRGAESRLRATGRLLGEVRRWADDDIPVILLGDFNDDPGSEPHAALLENGSLRDAYAVARPGSDAGSWLGRRRLDWVLVSHEWDVVDAAIVADGPAGASDHAAVTADLRLR